jgi:hypothetical protein
VIAALGVAVVLVAAVLHSTLSAIFRVALYRVATHGDAPGRFTATQLSAAFAPGKGKSRPAET